MFQLFLAHILTALKPFNILVIVLRWCFSVVDISVIVIPFTKNLLGWLSLSLGFPRVESLIGFGSQTSSVSGFVYGLKVKWYMSAFTYNYLRFYNLGTILCIQRLIFHHLTSLIFIIFLGIELQTNLICRLDSYMWMFRGSASRFSRFRKRRTRNADQLFFFVRFKFFNGLLSNTKIG